MSGGPVAFILKGYPRLSETFIAQEMLGLERAGLDIRIFAMRHPTDGKTHPVNAEIRAPVRYLPEYLHQEPLRVLRALAVALPRARFWRMLPGFLGDLRREPTRNRLRRFGQALVLAAELPGDVRRLHAHFIHTPASVTLYASRLTGLPWSCCAHAKDIWTSPPADLAEKLAAASFVTTCTRVGQAHLQHLAPPGKPVHLIYHGLDLERFRPLWLPGPPGDAGDAPAVAVLSVGRAVEKKGFDVLLAALARLPTDLAWRWTHVGGGPMLAALRRRAGDLGLEGRVAFLGALDQAEVLAQYRRADLFVLPSRIAADGDRDGLPNVLMEAQSQGVACLSTLVSAIPELIEPEVTGVLVPPDDAPALAAALERLLRDPALRARLGEAGQRRVERLFGHRDGIRRLLALFDPATAAPRAEAAE